MLLIITGPTASGKSQICFEIAKNNNGVIINCDSKQIYREIPIITAQPCQKYLDAVKHKLYGYVSVNSPYSVNSWLNDFNETLQSLKNNEIPIITGGSGLYITSLVKGISKMPEISENTRAYTKNMLDTLGKKKLYELLIKKDPLAVKINMNDSYRLMRAFETIIETNISIYQWHKNIITPSRNNINLLVFLPPRELIYTKINKRFELMLENGIIKEVKKLIEMNLPSNSPALKAHGVPEIIDYLNNKITLEKAIELTKTNIRHYAKRQYTWFKNQFKNVKFITNESELIKEINNVLLSKS